ncbi:MAG: BamA/TamA family outer membrane protein [Proteobacteria bacterium]|nr:BamA/TamA family outer membrane protein [Pseudomonadota bacterium]
MGWVIVSTMANTRFLHAEEENENVLFEIKGYMVEGNSILAEEELMLVLQPYTGPGMSAETVNTAKDALEKFYHNQGYPTVLVNIPMQTLDSNMVKFQVVESRIGKVRVSGNEYFTMKRLLRSLPSITPGNILYLPQLEKELNRLNRNPNITVAPVLGPGKEFGTIDVELKVKDRLPLNASLEMNNYSTHTTTDLRSSFKINYDNFWQRDHSLSLQFQTSPEDPDEVKVIAGSYLMGSFLNEDHMVACYAVWSDSDVAIVDDLRVISKGSIFGIRYIIPLPAMQSYYHNLTLGMDYKKFDEVIDLNPTNKGTSTDSETATDQSVDGSTEDSTSTDTSGSENTDTSSDTGNKDESSGIDYLPVSITYGASFDDPWGRNQFSMGVGAAFRGLVTDQSEFELKRYKARASYMTFNFSLTREQNITESSSVYTRMNAQLATMPLISNEQFFGGGASSVRGYKENEATGDSGISGTIEIRLPDVGTILYHMTPWLNPSSIRPYLFYDIAELSVQQPLPEQKSEFTLQGTGMGLRGNITQYFHYQFDMGYPLVSTENIDSGDLQFYFKVSGEF